MSTTDPAGFAYELEAARQRANHRVDAAAAELGSQARVLAEVQAQHDAVVAESRRLAQSLAPEARARIDPQRVLAGAVHLARLQQRVAVLVEHVDAGREAVIAARQGLEQVRIGLEAFDKHREEAVAMHRQLETQRLQAAVDQDWLALRHWRHRQADADTPGARETGAA